MAKGGYIGDGNNKARKLKKAYVGDVNGKARKIKKIYIGDANGKARLCWTGNINTLVTWSQNQRRLAYNDNLQTWNNNGEDSISYIGGTFGNGRFVRFRPDIASYSEDGKTWTRATPNRNLNLSPIEFIDGKFVGYIGLRNNANVSYTSTNGYTWFENGLNMNDAEFLNYSPSRVIKCNDVYVMIGSNIQTGSNYGKIFTSSDMVNWYGKYTNVNRYFNNISYGNEICVVIGTNYGTNNGFTVVSNDFFNTANLVMGKEYVDISFGNGKFVALNGNSSNPSIDYSTDGINWETGLNLFSFPDRRQLKIIFTGEKFYTVGDNGYSYYSTDGKTWTQSTGLQSLITYNQLIYSIDGGGKQPFIS